MPPIPQEDENVHQKEPQTESTPIHKIKGHNLSPLLKSMPQVLSHKIRARLQQLKLVMMMMRKLKKKWILLSFALQEEGRIVEDHHLGTLRHLHFILGWHFILGICIFCTSFFVDSSILYY